MQRLSPNSPLTLKLDDQLGYTLADLSLQELVKRFGSPLYLIDQASIEANCQAYTQPLQQYYPNSQVYYAAKANINIGLLDLIGQQGLGADVVSLVNFIRFTK